MKSTLLSAPNHVSPFSFQWNTAHRQWYARIVTLLFTFVLAASRSASAQSDCAAYLREHSGPARVHT